MYTGTNSQFVEVWFDLAMHLLMCVFFRISVAFFFSSATKRPWARLKPKKVRSVQVVGWMHPIFLGNWQRTYFWEFSQLGKSSQVDEHIFQMGWVRPPTSFFFQAPKQLCGRLCWSAVSCGFAAPVQFLRQLRTQQLDNDTQFWSQVEFQKIANKITNKNSTLR